MLTFSLHNVSLYLCQRILFRVHITIESNNEDNISMNNLLVTRFIGDLLFFKILLKRVKNSIEMILDKFENLMKK